MKRLVSPGKVAVDSVVYWLLSYAANVALGVRLPSWFNFFFGCKHIQNQLLRAPIVDIRFDASRRGKKGLQSLVRKCRGTNRSREGGEEPGMCPQVCVTTTR